MAYLVELNLQLILGLLGVVVVFIVLLRFPGLILQHDNIFWGQLFDAESVLD